MKKIHRRGAAVLLAALSIGMTGCSSPPPDIPAPANSEPAPQGSPGEGVTNQQQLFGLACQQLPQGGTPGSVARIQNAPVATGLADNPYAKTFAIAVGKAGMTDALNSAPAQTVFVPYEAAWTDLKQSLGPDAFNALLADPKHLSDILKYHVMDKRYDRQGLIAAHDVTTLQGGHLIVSDAGDTLTIKGAGRGTAHVLCGNIPAKNATVFFIDKVLSPSAP